MDDVRRAKLQRHVDKGLLDAVLGVFRPSSALIDNDIHRSADKIMCDEDGVRVGVGRAKDSRFASESRANLVAKRGFERVSFHVGLMLDWWIGAI